MVYGRSKRESHEKSMGSYERFAWNDAIAIAQLLDEEIGAPRARKTYDSLNPESVVQFERDNHEFIAEFIQKTEGQRTAYLRRRTKGMDERAAHNTIIVMLVLAIIGCVRARDVLNLRDEYRSVLAPGSGNRITTASVYAFANEMKDIYQYDWPWEVFNAVLIDDEGDEFEEAAD